MATHRDFLGSIILVGDRGVRRNKKKWGDAFVKFTIIEIDNHATQPIRILDDGASRRSRSRLAPTDILCSQSFVKRIENDRK